MLPSTDRSFEYFWRQAVRWVAGSALDPVTINAPPIVVQGQSTAIDIEARNAAFAPVSDARIEATITDPGSQTRPLQVRRSAAANGGYAVDISTPDRGLYRLSVVARQDEATLGSVTQWLYAGGVDREFVDPGLNEAWLRRAARLTGGRYLRPSDAPRIVGWLQDDAPVMAAPEQQDLWHEPWALGFVIILLSAEWILRRRWGLR